MGGFSNHWKTSSRRILVLGAVGLCAWGMSAPAGEIVGFGEMIPTPMLMTNGVTGDPNLQLDGTNGALFAGTVYSANLGKALSMGDANGDGLDDMLFCDLGVAGNTGAVYLVYGKTTPFSTVNMMTNTWVDGTNGCLFRGRGGGRIKYVGQVLSFAGDVNGDGLDDMLILGEGYTTDRDEVYLVYGRSNGMPSSVILTNTWLDGTNGAIFKLQNYSATTKMCAAGDVNGDGLGDMLISDYYASSHSGETYLVYGRMDGFPAYQTLTNSWPDGTNGTRFLGGANNYSGSGLSSAGDVNGDGYDDFLIGAYYADPEGVANAGEVYLVYGCSNGFPETVTLTTSWLDGTNGCILSGTSTNGYLGYNLSAGDVNGDGYSDLLLGEYSATIGAMTNAGAVHLVYGRSNGLPASVMLSTYWLDGTNGIMMTGCRTGVQCGISVSAGDINADGLCDMVFGARNSYTNRPVDVGEVYVVYGRSNGYPAMVLMTNTWLDSTNGCILQGAEGVNFLCGSPVNASGDINGDNYADLLVASSRATSPAGVLGAGVAYLLYGNGYTPPVVPASGTWQGGFRVTIHGSNLCAGADVTDVTLCGVSVTNIESQVATQIVVWADSSPTSGVGDVVVYSTSCGTTVASNAFTYLEPFLDVMTQPGGTVTNGAAASATPGMRFGTKVGSACTNVFCVTNNGDMPLTISGWTTNSSTPDRFTVMGPPASIEAGGAANFKVIYTPDALGEHELSLSITSDNRISPFVIHMTGFGFTVSTNAGPFQGGNTVTFSDYAFGAVTNALVEGVEATVVDSGTNGFSIVMPRVGKVGCPDILVKTSDKGEWYLRESYAYHVPGDIGGHVDDWSQWQALPAIPGGLCAENLASLNGTVYSIGGLIGSTYCKYVYRFDETNWTRVADISQPYFGMATVEYHGNIYLIGGRYQAGSYDENNRTYRFDGTTWRSAAAHLPYTVCYLSACVWNDEIYTVGGAVTNASAFNGTSWSPVPGRPYLLFSLMSVYDDKIYCVGGQATNTSIGEVLEFSGAEWTQTIPLSQYTMLMAGGVVSGKIFAVGGAKSSTGYNVYTNAYTFSHREWYEANEWVPAMGIPRTNGVYNCGYTVADGALYMVGGHDGSGNRLTNAWRYPYQTPIAGLDVTNSSMAGGVQVTIKGENLGNGTDITNVTFCGVPVSTIHSQSATQLVVTIGASTSGGTGDVVVYSTSYGPTVETNGFAYLPPTYSVYGTNHVVITNNAAYQTANGTQYKLQVTGVPFTNTFTITNTSLFTLNISDVITNGAGANQFAVRGMPSSLASGQVGTFDVIFTPSSFGLQTAAVVIVSDAVVSNFTLRLGGIGCETTANNGPSGGGNSVTYSVNGTFGTITNVLVGGISVIPTGSSTNWFTITMPAATGTVNVVVQNSIGGNYTLVNAYTFNQPGSIGNDSVYAWEAYAAVPFSGQVSSLAGLSNQIYIVNSTTNFWRYTEGSGWEELAPLTVPDLYGTLLLTYSNAVYSIGGDDAPSWTHQGVYRFNGSDWEYHSTLPHTDYQFAKGVFQDKMYVLGGQAGTLTNVWYCEGTNWVAGPGMPYDKSSFGCGVLNGRLYAASGCFTPTNMCSYDGTSWTEESGIPFDLGDGYNAASVLHGNLYVLGGSDEGVEMTNVFRFSGSTWTAVDGMPVGMSYNDACTMGDYIYAAGGWSATNIYRYGGPAPDHGVLPQSGSWTGGYPVVITGTNLCGNVLSDVTEVTLCGVTATVVAVYQSTQIVVTAGAAAFCGSGDVVVVSTAYGTTIGSNLFTYLAPGMLVKSPNDTVIANDDAASPDAGTQFSGLAGSTCTNIFSISNNGNITLNISGWTTNGSGASAFQISNLPSEIAAGGISNFTVIYAPPAVGDHAVSVDFVSDAVVSPFRLNLAGACYEVSTNQGPYGGGNAVTFTNGNFGAITNVMVGGVMATITASGSSWVTVSMPAVGANGPADVVVQTSDNGNIALTNAYTYNVAGWIPRALSRLPSYIVLTNRYVGSWFDGTNGFIMGGVYGEFVGKSVDSAGDINGDGYDDMLVGAPSASGSYSYSGKSFLIYGTNAAYRATNVLSSAWLNRTNGIIMYGGGTNNYFGESVSSAGDFNGDGYDDMLIGACTAHPTNTGSVGEAYVIYGRRDFYPTWDMLPETWLKGTNGFKMAGVVSFDYAGYSVSSAGDVNGDGYDDVLIGAYNAKSMAGETYLVFGTSNTMPEMVTLTNTWLDGTNGVTFVGAVTNDNSGCSVSGAGDVNGDGYDDMLIGAYGAQVNGHQNSGSAYLVYGRSNGFPATVTLTNTWLDGTNGVSFITGNLDVLGRSVHSAGDVNGDGYADVLIGAPAAVAAETNCGVAYLIYGGTNPLPATVTLSNTWPDGTNGAVLLGASFNDSCGDSVCGAGDVDGDGYDDMLIGADRATMGGYAGAGATYLVYGGAHLPPSILLTNTWLDGTNGIIMAGCGTDDYCGWGIASAGDIDADGYDDLLLGMHYNNEAYLVFGRENTYPVVPSVGSYLGGYQVVIIGTNLGNGVDVTNVTLCGVAVTNIESQSSTQVVVWAGQSATGGVGNVAVYSTSYGTTIRSNIFTYDIPAFSVLGTNNAVITNNAAMNSTRGTQFKLQVTGTSWTNTLTLTNTSVITVNITGISTNGTGAGQFAVSGIPASLAGRATASVDIVFTPLSVGMQTAAVVIVSDAAVSNFVLNIGGQACGTTANSGPSAGGNSVTFSNGSFGTITNVLVGGVSVTPTASGTTWFTITMPSEAPGTVNIVVQNSSGGSTTLENAYTFNPAGSIVSVVNNSGSWTGNYDVVITGTNLCNGTTGDVTGVTLCGVTATVTGVEGSTQIVVTAGTCYTPSLGDVVVVSTDYGTTIKSNIFTYTGTACKLLGTNGAQITSGNTAQVADGTKFMTLQINGALTNTFSITNSGTIVLTISGWTTNDADADQFAISGIPDAVEVGGVSNFTVVYAPTSAGSHATSLVISNDSPITEFALNLAGSCFAASTNVGPYAGGNTVTFTNGHFGTITNVLVGGVTATITASGTSWVTVIMPSIGMTGTVDVVVQTSDNGDTTLADAYTYNQAGSIGSVVEDWGNWESVAGLPVTRSDFGVGTLNGTLYVVGGLDGSFNCKTNVYGFDGSSWTSVPGLPFALRGMEVCEYAGALYSVGGINDTLGATNVLKFDGTNWTAAESLPSAMSDSAAASYSNSIYVFGHQFDTNAYKYNGSTWTSFAQYPSGDLLDIAATAFNGYMYGLGGDTAVNGETNVYYYNGTSWTAVKGLPSGAYDVSAETLNGAMYVYGGYEIGTTVYKYDGTNWTTAPSIPDTFGGMRGGLLNGKIYAIGDGMSETNVYRYPASAIDPGVSPQSGSWTGNYEVVITGTNLCNGSQSDVTEVTLCGVSATATAVYGSTQIVVTAGQSLAPGLGDVVVCSTSYGTTTKSNAFTYTGGQMALLGTNGAAITSGNTVQYADGSKFAGLTAGVSLTNRFSITNSGNDTLTISEVTTNGSGAAEFQISNLPSEIAVGGVSNFTVIYTPTAVGSHAASLVITSDDPVSPFTFNLAGSCFAASTNVGPYAGGNTVTFTNGNFGTITNVLVGGVAATITDSGTSWFTITMPTIGTNGAVDIVVQTSDSGETTLANAYTYHSAGSMGGMVVDGFVWTNLAQGFNSTVYAVCAATNGAIYAGGAFTQAVSGVESLQRVARWDGTAWTNMGIGFNNIVRGIQASASGTLYTVGDYNGTYGFSQNCRRVGRWDGENWTNMGFGFSTAAYTIGFDTHDVPYVGGAFNADGYGRNFGYAVTWDGGNWTNIYYSPLTNAIGFGNSVRASLTAPDGKMYFAGDFTNAITPTGTMTLSRVAMWDGTDLHALGDGFNSSVYALAMDRAGTLYAGGLFTASGSQAMYFIARWDGVNWTNVGSGMNGLVYALAVDANDNLYAGGSFSTPGAKLAMWDGASWSGMSAGEINSDIYALGLYSNETMLAGGGFTCAGAATNRIGLVHPNRYYSPGTTPTSGSWTGGYTVAIIGDNIGGGDITNVTLCGVQATILSQIVDRVWVRAGQASSSGSGDVVIASIDYGITTGTNAFTYCSSEGAVLGTNGAAIISGDLPTPANGSKYAPVVIGSAWTNTFGITNGGDYELTITDVSTSGLGSASFKLSGVPSSVSIGGVSNFTAVYDPTAIGSHAASIVFESDDVHSPFILNLAGSCYEVSTNVGPYAGGNTVTFTNGNFGTITNVLVGGVAATITDFATSWVTVTMPSIGTNGTVDVIVQTSDNGDTVLSDAYTYNVAGEISAMAPSSGSWTGNYEVVITGTNLCNGGLSDVTGVTLCGVTATPSVVYGSTQIVVTVGQASDTGTGNVVITSTSYGSTTKSNGFEYLKEAQTITYAAISNRVYGEASFDPGATAGSGLSVSYSSSDANTATVSVHSIYITGTGTCDIVASQAGNVLYFAAPDYTNTLTVTAKPLTVAGTTASNKVYDSTVTAWLSGAVLQGAVTGDDVVLSNTNTGTLAQATTGSAIAVTTYMTLTGTRAGQYTLTQPAGITADITARELTVTGAVAQSKVYDRTTAATLSNGGGLAGVQGGDSITLENNSTGTFATADVGTNIAVTSYMTISGAQVANYTLTLPDYLAADISKANQTISFSNPGNQFWTNSVGLSATATSSGTVTFAVMSGSAQITGATNLSFTGYGEVSITADQAGDANWNAAPRVTNTFQALGPEYTLFGTNGTVITSDAAADSSNGTYFGDVVIVKDVFTNTFTLTNSGNAGLTILSIATNGDQASSFSMPLTQTVIAASSMLDIPVVFDPKTGGSNAASFVFTFDATNSSYVLNVGGFALGGGYYIAHQGQTPVSPYYWWTSAASNIQDAVDVATNDGVMQVGGGTYNEDVDCGTNRFVWNIAEDVVLNGTLTGSGGLIKTDTGTLYIAHAAWTGDTVVAGGTLSISGTLEVVDGTLTLTNGAVLEVDELVVTNAGSGLDISGGTLDAGSIRVDTGVPVNVGDGENPTELPINGTNIWFVGGVIVNSNATLSGAGTLHGDVTLTGGSTLNPGTNGAVGTLAFDGDMTVTGRVTYAYDRDGSTGDLVQVSSNLTFESGTEILVNLTDLAGSGSFGWGDMPLIEAGSITGAGNLTVLFDYGTTGLTNFAYKVVGGTVYIYRLSGYITTAPSSLSFDTIPGVSPPNQTLTLGDSGEVQYRYVMSTSASWLAVSPVSGTLTTGGTDVLTVSVDGSSFSAGTYFSTAQVVSVDCSNSPVAVAVSVEVKSPSGYYVAQEDQSPYLPYYSWGTAASNIQDAVDVATNGGVLHIGSGTYTGDVNGGSSGFTWDTTGQVYIVGTVTDDGGLTKTGTGTLYITDAAWTGDTVVAGGTLSVSGTLDVVGGTLTLTNGGVLEVDELVVTNAGSGLDLSGGTLDAGTIRVDTGVPVEVGDGENEAELVISGTNVWFGSGVSVNSNAALSGEGTLHGDVTLNDGSTVDPGTNGATGTLTIDGDMTVTGCVTYVYDRNGSTGDLVQVTSNLTIESGTEILVDLTDLAGSGSFGWDDMPLIEAGSITGTNNLTVLFDYGTTGLTNFAYKIEDGTVYIYRLSGYITNMPISLFFEAVPGVSPSNQTLTLGNSGAVQYRYVASTSASWLAVSPVAGTITTGAADVLTVSVDGTGFAVEDTYVSTIQVVSVDCSNSPLDVVVSVEVKYRGGIVLGTNQLAYTGIYVGTNPARQELVMTNGGLTRFNWTNTISYSAGASGWLTCAPDYGLVASNSATVLTNSISLTGINAGTYYATNVISAPDATNSPQSYVVSLTVDKASQTITFDNPGTQIVTNEVGLQVSAVSGLSVTCEVISGSASITGYTNLTFTRSGQVTIAARQAGNSNWNAAASVTNTFRVDALLPGITTLTAGDVDQTTFASGGNITYDGGAPVTQRGLCWNLAGTPTISDALTRDGRGSGVYASVARGLSSGTTYYLRAYAINEVGTSYGNEITVTTSNAPPTPPAPDGYTWTGASDDQWANAANWYGGVVPSATNYARFATATSTNLEVDLNGNQEVLGILLLSNLTSYVVFSGGSLLMTNEESLLMVTSNSVLFSEKVYVGGDHLMACAAGSYIQMEDGIQTEGDAFKYGEGILNLPADGDFGGNLNIMVGSLHSIGTQVLSGASSVNIMEGAAFHPGDCFDSLIPGALTLANETAGTPALVVDGTWHGALVSYLNDHVDLGSNTLVLGSNSVLDISVLMGLVDVTNTYTLATYAGITGTFAQVNGLTAHTLNYGTNALTLEPTFVWEGSVNSNWSEGLNWLNSGGAVPGTENDAGFVVTSNDFSVNLDTNPSVRGVHGAGIGWITLDNTNATLILTNSAAARGDSPIISAQDGTAFALNSLIQALPGSHILAHGVLIPGLIQLFGGIHVGEGSGNLVLDGGGYIQLTGSTVFDGSDNLLELRGVTLFTGNANSLGGNGLLLTNNGALLATNSMTIGLPISLAGNGCLGAMNSNDTLTVTNSITGGGLLTIVGEGTVILTASNQVGAVNVETGRLLVQGSLQSEAYVDVQDGDTFGGHGEVGIESSAFLLFIRNGALLSPGASIGTLTVEGSLAVDGGWTVEVENDSNDVVHVRDTLTLGTTSSLTVTGTPDGVTAYTFATFASRSGQFGSFSVPKDYIMTYGDTNLVLLPRGNEMGSTNVTRDGGTLNIPVTEDSNTSWNVINTSSWITVTSGSGGTGTGLVTLVISANDGRERSAMVWIAGKRFEITQRAHTAAYLDFDGDAIADITVYAPEYGMWYILQSMNNAGRFQAWGWNEAIPVPGDYDGDGSYDIAVYSPEYGMWYIWLSATQTSRIQAWGYENAWPVPGDYDGDGIWDLAVYIPETGLWSIWQSASQTARFQAWGFADAEPVPADYDGDGMTDLAVYVPDTGTWLIWQSATQTARSQAWGWSEAWPIPGDYDGDGLADVAVYEPASGFWLAWLSTSQSMMSEHWGWNQAWPVPADYDGDRKFDRTVYAAVYGTWSIWQSAHNSARTQGWGFGEAEPVN